MPNFKLLSKYSSDAKTAKSNKSKEYLTAILYMAPYTQVKGINPCPMAKLAQCHVGCLYTAGHGAFNNVQQARQKKSMLYRDNKELFFVYLREDLTKHEAYCKKKNVIPVVRLNGTTDINYFNIIREFPDIQFYDYTKVYNRVAKNNIPTNYHLTLSYSEASKVYAVHVLAYAMKHNANLAVVFRNKELPDTYLGLKVINGDKNDLRFLDTTGVVVGLYAKGRAKKDTTGFVIDNM